MLNQHPAPRPIDPVATGLVATDHGATDHGATGRSLGRLGALDIVVARTEAEIRRAQQLRFAVFYEEMSAIADQTARLTRRDADRFDPVCDHLVVVDHNHHDADGPVAVATCRLLRQDAAERFGGFYSAGEFDLAPLLARHQKAQFLELGRSCVLAPYRNKRTIELLWHGIWQYVRQHRSDVLIGCGSLPGTDLDRLAMPLSFLHHYARASDVWNARALPDHYVDMHRMPRTMIDMKLALQTLPPLLKGYLRLGARVADGAVVDRQFGTTDVLVILPVETISGRYIEYFGAERRAA